MRAYAQSGQYHTIVESCVRCPKISRANRLVNLQMSNKELEKTTDNKKPLIMNKTRSD